MGKGYNRVNKLRLYRNVINVVKKHYIEGVTTYAGIYREYVNPVYPMSYGSFLKIINTPNIERQLNEAILNKAEDETPPNQLKLFEEEEKK
jgi:hypothetical protein